MYLNISKNGAVTLEEVDDFKRFHITGDVSCQDFQVIAEEAGDDHFWLDADALVRLSGRSEDESWCVAFWHMLEKAEPYGFSDVAGHRIKSHVA